MTSWAERMHRRATTLGSVVTSCGHGSGPYLHRLEKVKFGVPLDEVCKNDIPGPLLVLILKLNKEAPCKKDVFRAPGHQGNMKKLVHFLQTGRLVNMDNFSVYTIASVLKKFLRKLPGGIFGREGEQRLFTVIDMGNKEEQRDEIHSPLNEDLNYMIAKFRRDYLEFVEAEADRARQKILLSFCKQSASSGCSSPVPAKRSRGNETESTVTCEAHNMFRDCFNEVPNKNTNSQCGSQGTNMITREIDYYLETIGFDCNHDPYI